MPDYRVKMTATITLEAEFRDVMDAQEAEALAWDELRQFGEVQDRAVSVEEIA